MSKKNAWKPRTYTGALNTPIKRDHRAWAARMIAVGDDPVAALDVDAQFDAETARLFNEKIELLFAEFKIGERYGGEDGFNRWECLAKELAYAHVPGFRSADLRAPVRGAPKKWDAQSAGELVLAILKAQRSLWEQKGHKPTIRDAVRRAIKDNPGKWPARGGGKMKPEDLQKRYNEALKIVRPILKPVSPLQALLNYRPKK